MDSAARHLIRDLRRLLGREEVGSTPFHLATYAGDASSATGGRADAVVFPRTTADVVAVVRLCRRLGVPLTPRGAGTDLSGGATPYGGVVVSFTRMNRILAIDPVNRVAVVQPGVVNLTLQREVERQGLIYAPDPASQKISTLGGNVAKGAGGMRAFKYGVTKDHVLGLEVVLADGTVGRIGGATCGCGSRGPDLGGLFIGSEGTLGVVTELTLRLVPKPPAYRTMLAVFDRLEGAGDAVSSIVAQGIIPATLELMDRDTLLAIEDFTHAGLPTEAAAALLIEVDGLEESVAPVATTVEAACRQAGATEVRLARSDEERERLWYARRSAMGAMARLAPDFDLGDFTVPRDRLTEMLAQTAALGAERGLRIPQMAHAGDGNLHPYIVYDNRRPGEHARVVAALEELGRRAIALGGNLSGEHGIGCLKRDYMPWLYPEGTLKVMGQIKHVFDPGGSLNPGKVLPIAPQARPHRELGHKAPTIPGQASRQRDPASADSPRHPTDGTSEPSEWVRPAAEEAVSELLARASRERVAVHPRGGGTRWAACLRPFQGGIGLDLRSMDAIASLDPGNLTVTAGAGCTFATVQAALSSHGLYLPAETASPGASTLGGALAADSTGPRRLAYGSFRSWVLGCRAVFADGIIGVFGGKQAKNSSGYNVARLLCGSLGTLGVVTQVTLKLRPRPESSRVFVFRGPAGRVLAASEAARLTVPALAALEVIWPGAECGRKVSLIAGLEGRTEDTAVRESALLQAAMDAGLERSPGLKGAPGAVGQGSPGTGTADAFWEEHQKVVTASLAATPGSAVWHLAVAPADLGRILGPLLAHPNLRALCAHAGTGEVELAIAEDASAAEMAELIRSIRAVVLQAGGFFWPADPALVWHPDEVRSPSAFSTGLWRRLKAELDPAGILSPAATPVTVFPKGGAAP